MAEIRFDGKVAVVTGAGGGLGKSYALLLAARGAKVVVNDLGGTFDGNNSDVMPAKKVVDEIKARGGEAVASYDSVAEWDNAQNIIRSAIDAYGRIDILVNNAGILRDKSFLKMDIEDYRKVISVHLDGTFFCTKAAFPHMREQNYGRIVSTTSTTGVYGNFGQANYGTAKMGIVGLMNCLTQEGTRYGILANTIVPQAGTRMTETVMPQDLVEKLKPDYVAPIVAWLCSDQCDVGGKMFCAGGGYFSRAAVVEGPGVFFDPSREITVEIVAERIDEIKKIKGGQEFNSAIEQTGYILNKINIS